MTKQAKRRLLKNRFAKQQNNTVRAKSGNFTVGLFIISLTVFCLSQLIINSILSPLGEKLQSFNTEKTLLLEENRELEEEIAETNSLAVIENITKKKLDLKDDANKRIIYIDDSAIRAEN